MSFLNKSDVKNHFSVHHSDRVVMSTDEPQAAAGVVLRDLLDNPRQVYSFLKRHPNKPFCDGCIEDSTGLPHPQVNVIARTLALFRLEFRKRSTVCSQCGKAQESTEAISAVSN